VPAAKAAEGKYSPDLLQLIDHMLNIDETKRPASVAAVRTALLETTQPQHVVEAIPPRKFKLTNDGAGQVLLEFDQPISADILELAFQYPGGEYLRPAVDDQPGRQKEPYYFSLARALSRHERAAFTAGPEISAQLDPGTSVTISSPDGFIHASVNWPGTTTPQRRRSRRGAIAAALAFLIIGTAAAVGRYFYVGHQTHLADDHKASILKQLFEAKLINAGNNRPALEQFLSECDNSCPTELRSQAQSRLQLIRQLTDDRLEKDRSEAAIFESAQGDIDQLNKYMRDCQICTYKSDALVKIARLENEEKSRRETLAFESAHGKIDQLDKYLKECQLCTHESDARNEIGRLEINAKDNFERLEYQSARGNIDQLKKYLRECKICAYDAVAREEIGNLQHQARESARPRPKSASEDCAAFYRSIGTDTYCASSVLSPQSGNTYGVRHLFESDENTAWVEGKPGQGLGEWVVVEFDKLRAVRGITIKNGYQKNSDIFYKNSRVRRLRLVFSQGDTKSFALEDRLGNQNINFDAPIRSHWIQFIIDDVFPGSKYTDTAISKLVIATENAN
jgi:hypothetical protein